MGSDGGLPGEGGGAGVEGRTGIRTAPSAPHGRARATFAQQVPHRRDAGIAGPLAGEDVVGPAERVVAVEAVAPVDLGACGESSRSIRMRRRRRPGAAPRSPGRGRRPGRHRARAARRRPAGARSALRARAPRRGRPARVHAPAAGAASRRLPGSAGGRTRRRSAAVHADELSSRSARPAPAATQGASGRARSAPARRPRAGGVVDRGLSGCPVARGVRARAGREQISTSSTRSKHAARLSGPSSSLRVRSRVDAGAIDAERVPSRDPNTSG